MTHFLVRVTTTLKVFTFGGIRAADESAAAAKGLDLLMAYDVQPEQVMLVESEKSIITFH